MQGFEKKQMAVIGKVDWGETSNTDHCSKVKLFQFVKKNLLKRVMFPFNRWNSN